MPQKGLNPKQKAFVREYLKDFNATQAAKRAGYSEKTARSQGQRLLTNDDVAKAIAKGQERAAKRADLKVDDIVRMYREVAELDVTKVARWNDRGEVIFTRFEDIPPEVRRCISEIRHGEDKFGRPYPIVKFHNAMEARKLLGMHLGMNKTTVEMPDVERAMSVWEKTQQLLAAKRKREAGEKGGGDGS